MNRAASLRMRGVHAVSRRTVRPLLDAFAGLEPHAPGLVPPFLWLSSNVEQVARVLVPVPGTTCRPVDLGDCRAEWVWHGDSGPDEVARGAILYCHGGGFLFGGLHSHRRLLSRVSRGTGLPILNVDYRQLPEATIVESQTDAMAGYQHLLASGVPADRIMFAGDSAGGGLVLSTAIAARNVGLPLPAGIMTMSPLADYDSSARRAHANDLADPVLSFRSVTTALRLCLADTDPTYSPVHHDFTGLPPMLVQVGSTEVFLPDAESVVSRCVEASIPCEFQVWDRGIHVFPAFADLAPEGHRAIAEMARFSRALVDPMRQPLRSVRAA